MYFQGKKVFCTESKISKIEENKRKERLLEVKEIHMHIQNNINISI